MVQASSRLAPAARTSVSVYGSFDILPENCQRWFAHCAADVFSELAWYRNLEHSVLGRTGLLRIYVVSGAAGPRLIIPMWHGLTQGSWKRRCLQAASNFYSALFTPCAVRDAEAAELFGAWAAALAAERPRWDQVQLAPMDRGCPLHAAAAQALAAAGFLQHAYFCFANWHAPVLGRSYADFFAGLPSALRHTVLRKSRRLVALPACRVALLTAPEQAGECLRAVERVYQRSWKCAEPFAAFVPGLILTCASQGWLRMGVVYLDELPIAFQLWIVRGDTASVYKLAYDHAHAALSAGSVLTARLSRHVIDVDRVAHIDYLHGDEAYKRDWMSERRERWGIAAFNPRTLQGWLGALRHRLGWWRKRWRRLF